MIRRDYYLHNIEPKDVLGIVCTAGLIVFLFTHFNCNEPKPDIDKEYSRYFTVDTVKKPVQKPTFVDSLAKELLP